jgi:hypothetical protein
VILDWTAAALQQRIDRFYAEGELDSAVMTEGLLELYELGEMSIAWEDGAPLYRWICDTDPPHGELSDDQ